MLDGHQGVGAAQEAAAVLGRQINDRLSTDGNKTSAIVQEVSPIVLWAVYFIDMR